MNPSVGLSEAVFFLLLPIGCFCLGSAALRWVRYPIRSAHPFPIAFLSGSVIALLLLFVLHVLPISLRVADVIVLLLGIVAYAMAPKAERRQPAQSPAWLALGVVVLILCAGTLWTQDLRPYSMSQGEQIIVKPWADIFLHAQSTSQLHDDISIVRLGNPDLVGKRVGIYHFASYMLPASIEAWSNHLSAMDCVAAFWIPFGFVIMGFGAFVLASEWWGDVAGIAAMAAVLLIPDAPTYGIPLSWFSYYWLIAISAGLAYGIAGAALALVLIYAAIELDRMWLLACGFILLLSTVLLKAHVTIVALPLAIAWVLMFKKAWSRRRRLSAAAIVGVCAILGAFALDKLQIGPNLFPRHPFAGVHYLSDVTEWTASGAWRHLSQSHPHGISRLPIVVFVAVAAPLGGWAVFSIVLLLIIWARRRLHRLDWMPILALAVYAACLTLLPPDQSRARDELWHRPFVWLYFIVAVWCVGRAADLIEKRSARTSSRAGGIAVLIAAILLIVPLQKGKSIQHAWTRFAGSFDTSLNKGFLDCADYIRAHSRQTDVAQAQVSTIFPLLSAYSERRCYLGLSPDWWRRYNHLSPLWNESLRRNQIVQHLPKVSSEQELQKIARETGIRWYIARPEEVLAWPSQRADKPAFTSHGYRLYELEEKSN
ncbi:MAG TPA: hypothetical protein VFW23_13905 [Tepidisphaeraceae bacterium]|nr:hypothetical protein [Tepidisphaeraceae bacterium]